MNYKNILSKKIIPRIYEYVIEFDRFKNLELFNPAHSTTVLLQKMLKKYFIFTCGALLAGNAHPRQ